MRKLIWNARDLCDQILRGESTITMPLYMLMRSNQVSDRFDAYRNVTLYRCQQEENSTINGKKVGPWWHRNACKGAADCDAPMVYDWSCLLSSVMEQSLPMVQTSRQCANDE